MATSRVRSRGGVGGADVSANEPLYEETVIEEYALVINGHSLVLSISLSSQEQMRDELAALMVAVVPPAGSRSGAAAGAGLPGRGLPVQICHLQPRDAAAEGPGGRAGEEVQCGRHAGDWRRSQ